MEILKGATVAAEIKEELLQQMKELDGYTPTLAIVRVGERPDDISYEKGAMKKMESVGIRVENYIYSKDISHEEFKKAFLEINEKDYIDGILLLRPLPKQINEKELEYVIKSEKDVDGIGIENMSKVYAGDATGYPPCTAQAVMEMLKFLKVPLEGKKVTILGRSLVLGKPLTMLLMRENATVTVCHTRTRDLNETCQNAEIVIAAMGATKAVKAEHIRRGAIVIDVGVNLDEDGRLCGDVDFENVSSCEGVITPVPGGVGAVTTTVLAKHVIESARKKRNKVAD